MHRETTRAHRGDADGAARRPSAVHRVPDAAHSLHAADHAVRRHEGSPRGGADARARGRSEQPRATTFRSAGNRWSRASAATIRRSTTCGRRSSVLQRAVQTLKREVEDGLRRGATGAKCGATGATGAARVRWACPPKLATGAKVRMAKPLDSYKYVGFEDQFRGSQLDIRGARRGVSCRFFEGASDVLDVGCGRGEFLDLLRATRHFGARRRPER